MTRAVATLGSFFLAFLIPVTALAAPLKMTDVSVKRNAAGLNVDITFDRPVSAKALKPVFERNFVQLVLKSTKVDAARMIPVAGSEVAKIFAYPYSPDTARVRLILKRDNDWAKGRVSLWNNNPRTVRVFVKDPQTDRTVVTSVAPKPAPAPVAPKTTTVEALAIAPTTSEDAKLLKEVERNTPEIDIHNPDSVKAALERTSDKKSAPGSENAISAVAKTEATQLGIKSDPSKNFLRMALVLLGIISFFIGGVLLVKRYATKLKKLPFGKKERLIQVVATHYLGNKKSISLVKVTGEYMVVGVSNEGISLISKLGPEVSVDKYLEDRFWGGTFEKHLGTYAKDTKLTKAIDLADELDDAALEAPKASPARTAAAGYDGARDLLAAKAEQGAAKVELSPVRASIKEKLTKLKPLS